MDWNKILKDLEEVEQFFENDTDHRPEEATDPDTGNKYCTGCTVAATAQELHLDIIEYLQFRNGK